MSPVAYKKRKEQLALALRIEKKNREAQTCSYYRTYFRCCFMDQAESRRCSEYIRSKTSCDSLGYKTPVVPRKVVCRFFCSPTCPPPVCLSPPPTSWFPAFELDTFLNSISTTSWGDPGEKEHREETRRDSQLPVSSGEVSAPADTP
jgi:hypothetical protein